LSLIEKAYKLENILHAFLEVAGDYKKKRIITIIMEFFFNIRNISTCL
jgi:hypothetical protein